MADLEKLKEFGDDIKGVLKDLFEKAGAQEDSTNDRPVKDVIAKLKAVIDRADRSTPAPLEARVAAITSVRSALTEVLLNAASNNVNLPSTQVRTIQTQRNALRNAFGLLLEREAFGPIVRLLSDSQIQTMSAQLDAAKDAVKGRQRAKKVLDTTVKVVITAGRIAAKVVA